MSNRKFANTFNKLQGNIYVRLRKFTLMLKKIFVNDKYL